MILTSDQIRSELSAIWPVLKFIVLSDKRFIAPYIKEFKALLRLFDSQSLPFIPGLNACEEFSFNFISFVRQYRTKMALGNSIQGEQLHNWAIGMVVGTKINNTDASHWCNIVRTEEYGWLMVEPQTGAVWTPSPESDSIYFLLM